MTSGGPGLANQLLNIGPVRRIERWLNAMPHPSSVLEISASHVAAARWGKSASRLESSAIEPLAWGSVLPSPVDSNVGTPDDARSALRRLFARVQPGTQSVALLIPDPVVRVFILPFDTLPRRADDALPLLRWRLKKSVPFDVDETVVSWMRQTGRSGGLEVVTAVARQRIIREYEELVESAGAEVGVIMSSTMATLPLLDDRGSTLLVRFSGRTLTTVIVRDQNLCVFRSSEMRSNSDSLEPQAVLDEIFPALAYYQDTWEATMDRARLSGFGAREARFREILSGELKCPIGSLADAPGILTLGPESKDIVQKELEPLAGWTMNRGA